ncbi:MAG: SLBB domain-containing protein [Longimicrobiales bacterium]
MTRRIVLSLTALAIFLPAAHVSGQLPVSPAQAQQLLRDNPELVRQRLRESGLTDAEIRARLSAMGYPASALDAFLSGGPMGPNSTFDPRAIAALESLGVVIEGADGLEVVRTVTGLDAPSETRASSPVFGHDVFRRATSRFQPLLSGPVSDQYRLGPGDRVLLLLTGEAELAHDLEVTREGFVVVPEVGRVSVANLTMAEVRTLFRERLAGFYSGIRRGTTSVSLTITELRTIQIYVVGEVEQPGAYQLSSVATVTNALYAANGPTLLGNLRDIRVRRRDGDDAGLDLYPYLLEGDISGDVTLEQGDVVFVPVKDRRVKLTGAVVRPKHYELAVDEDLIDVLAAGGGFAPGANRQRLTVFRVVQPTDRESAGSDRIAIDLALGASQDQSDLNHLGGVIVPPVGLQDGDSIVVSTVPELADGLHVTIAGLVQQPGMFPWRDGMTLRDLVELARGPIVGADLREAEVSRLPPDRADGQVAELLRVPMDSSYLNLTSPDGSYVGAAGISFPSAGSSPEFVLQPLDRVQILRQPQFRSFGTIAVTGEVSVPGRYTLVTTRDRVSDVISRAGGILESGHVEAARLIRSQDNLGRIDLDLAAALANPDVANNVLLQPDDSLHIPEYSPTVVVQGAVNSPVTVLWREGQDFNHYIEAAGGFRGDADEGRTSVRLASGLAQTRSKFLFWSSYPTPDAGSTISVPAKDPADRFDKVQFTSNLVAILGSLATLFIVIDRNSP